MDQLAGVRRLATVCLFAIVAVLGAPVPAWGVGESVPADVRAWFDRAGTIELIRSGIATKGVTVAGTVRTGVPQAVFAWTREFLTGRVSDRTRSLRATGEWVALASDDRKPVALVRAVRRGGTVTLAQLSTSPDPGYRAHLPQLDRLRPGEVLVEEPQIAAWFALNSDDVIRPVNRAADDLLPGSAPLERYGREAATRYRGLLDGEGSAGGEGDTGADGGADAKWIIAVVAAAAAAVTAWVAVHRRGRPEPDSTTDVD